MDLARTLLLVGGWLPCSTLWNRSALPNTVEDYTCRRSHMGPGTDPALRYALAMAREYPRPCYIPSAAQPSSRVVWHYEGI